MIREEGCIAKEGVFYVMVTYRESQSANHGKPVLGGCDPYWGGRNLAAMWG